MDGTQILPFGLGLESPWVPQTSTLIHPRLDLYVEAERGSLSPGP
ncbi:hypothetical protein [Chromohalobacter sp. 48-RD10]|nr:hypothetical protein [Chromohalobacter sp. 48-RD10]